MVHYSSTAGSQQLYRRAKELIPGGTQLLSKRPEMFAPEQWPAYYKLAHGCEIVDIDNNTYVDMSTMGVGSCLLGYSDPDVTSAVVSAVQRGSMSTLNPPEEVELAELLLKLHSWADNVRFLRAGGEAMSAAVRIARAATHRNVIAFCGYHGWHDWYLAANRTIDGPADQLREHLLPGLSPNGVPTQLGGTALPFSYNKTDELDQIVRKHGRELAAVVMEPTRSVEPQIGFFEAVRKLCDSTGAILIIDEITAGWRFALGGAHLRYGLEPDIAVFAKALGNGHPIAAVVGRKAVMQAAHESFISSTFWTENVGVVAALATIKKMSQVNVPAHLCNVGQHFRLGILKLANEHGLPLKVQGHLPLQSLVFDHPSASSLQTLLTVRMLKRGYLTCGSFYPSWSHQLEHIKRYLNELDVVFAELSEAIRKDDIERRIGGPVKHTGFKRLA